MDAITRECDRACREDDQGVVTPPPNFQDWAISVLKQKMKQVLPQRLDSVQVEAMIVVDNFQNRKAQVPRLCPEAAF